jgi:hypothetical protein
LEKAKINHKAPLPEIIATYDAYHIHMLNQV